MAALRAALTVGAGPTLGQRLLHTVVACWEDPVQPIRTKARDVFTNLLEAQLAVLPPAAFAASARAVCSYLLALPADAVARNAGLGALSSRCGADLILATRPTLPVELLLELSSDMTSKGTQLIGILSAVTCNCKKEESEDDDAKGGDRAESKTEKPFPANETTQARDKYV
jgi:hypothetical protein